MTKKDVPVLLLTGYLGSGKTTLINHILKNANGYKMAVIVNDLGEVNIDAELIQKGGVVNSKDDNLVALQNGCICCTLKADLIIHPGDILRIEGKIKALTRRQCVISLAKFDEKMDEKFEVLYADNPPTNSDEIIDIIDKGRIHLGEIVAEQYGLALNPFPKKPGVKNPYVEQEEEKQHPFANLKKILKK